MCAINGAFSLDPTAYVDNDLISQTIERAKERGRDSFGLYIDGEYSRTASKQNLVVGHVKNVLLSNNRAEPTTEYVKDKQDSDVQPYSKNGIVVVHNGTIANDKEICAKYELGQVKIDSMVLPLLLDKLWDKTLDGLIKVLNEEVVGSYALAVYDEATNKLFLACNYKPIYTCRVNDVLYFSSLDKFLPTFGDQFTTIQKMPAYSVAEINVKDNKIYRKLLNQKQLNKKAMVVCSGGLDSTVVAAQMVKEGYDVTLLNFQYKARAEDNETIAIRNIAKYLDVPLLEVETDVFKNVIKASRLTGTHDETIADGEAGAELAYEWVPARNLIMLSLATGIAEARGIETIALGNNLEEAGAYADNEQEFIYQFNKIIPNAINLDKRLRVIEPVGNLMKHEIVKLGLANNAPLHLTWSCYNKGELHCGTCGPCYMRKKAFEMNNTPEVIKYANDEGK